MGLAQGTGQISEWVKWVMLVSNAVTYLVQRLSQSAETRSQLRLCCRFHQAPNWSRALGQSYVRRQRGYGCVAAIRSAEVVE